MIERGRKYERGIPLEFVFHIFHILQVKLIKCQIREVNRSFGVKIKFPNNSQEQCRYVCSFGERLKIPGPDFERLYVS
jgi:hypothetical protein